jgi:cobalt-zinc-cadmium resistance protein CzcA
VSLYIQHKKTLDSYIKRGLSSAALIMQTANQKLNAGEINYLDWVVLMNQSIQTKADYYTAVMSYNEAAFELEKLNTIK